MAKVILKTDFKDGDKLYDLQLNNNFKVIKAALDALNTITWGDTPELLTLFRGTAEEIAERPIENGQLLCDITNGVMYVDFNGERIFTGGKIGPQGEKGDKGDTGDSGVYLGADEPTNPEIDVWLNPEGEAYINDNDIDFWNNKTDILQILTADIEAPENTIEGKYYFNTLENKLYKYESGNWVEKEVSETILYFDLAHRNIWYYDGADFDSYGGAGGTSGVGNIKNTYSESVTDPYSCKYINGLAITHSTETDIDTLSGTTVFEIFNAKGTLPSGYSTSDNNVIIQQYERDDSYIRQVLYDVHSRKILTRAKLNGEWSSWTKVLLNEDVSSLNIPKITSGTSTPSGGSNGDIYIQYF